MYPPISEMKLKEMETKLTMEDVQRLIIEVRHLRTENTRLEAISLGLTKVVQHMAEVLEQQLSNPDMRLASGVMMKLILDKANPYIEQLRETLLKEYY